jgi:hypothetical protein
MQEKINKILLLFGIKERLEILATSVGCSDLNSISAKMSAHVRNLIGANTERKNNIHNAICGGGSDVQAIRLQRMQALDPRLLFELALVAVANCVDAKETEVANRT